MARPWAEIQATPEYQGMDASKRLRMKEYYFRQNFESKIKDPDKLERFRTRFFAEDTIPAPNPAQDVGWDQALVSGANRGISNVLGMPADLAGAFGTWVANKIGKPEWGGPVPYINSQAIQEGLGKIGVDTTSFERGTVPQQIGGRVAQELSETASLFGPVAKIAKTGVRPLREGIAATGAGVGAGIAQQVAPDNPWAETLGALGGGVSTDLLAGMVSRAPSAAKGIAGSVMPATAGKTEKAVGATMAENASTLPYTDANMARAAQLKQQYGFDPTLPQASGDPYFIQQMHSASAKDPALDAMVRQRNIANNEVVIDNLRSVAPGGSVAETQRAIGDVYSGKLSAIDEADNLAMRMQNASLADIARVTSPQEVGKARKTQLQLARQKWKDQAKKNFDAIPETTPVPTENLDVLARRVVDESQGDSEIIPKLAYEFQQADDVIDTGLLGPNGKPLTTTKPKEVTFGYLRQKRTQLNREIESERGAQVPNRQKIRNLERLRTGVETAMGDWADAGNSAAAKQYKLSREHYRIGADKYYQGQTRTVLAQTGAGDPRVPDSAVMDHYFTSGKGGVENAQEFKRVFENDPESISAMNDHIVGRVADMAIDGKINPQVVRKYLATNKEALKEFPEARKRIQKFLTTREVTENTLATNKILRADAEKNIAKVYLGADPEKLIDRIVSGQNPRQKMDEVLKMVRGNSEAKAGLRRGFMDWTENRIISKVRNEAGGDVIMANQMRAFMKNNKDFVSKLYSPQEMKTIDDVLDMADIMQRQNRSAALAGSDTAAKLGQGAMSLSSIMSRLYGIERGVVSKRWVASEMAARIGNKIFGEANEQAARAVMREALVNPEFAKALMAKSGTVAEKKAANHLRVYLMSSGVVGAVDPEQEQFRPIGP